MSVRKERAEAVVATDWLLVEKAEAIVTLTLNRPAMRNALGADGDGDTMAAICADINADTSVRCVILTGAGSAFSAGGDLKAMDDDEGAFQGAPVHIRETYRRNVHRIARALSGLEVPLIAAVNGPAIGLGCDVVCMADVRIASETAKFGATFLKIGLVPGDGGAWLLPRAIGMSRAAELLFTGDVIDAHDACKQGLVSYVVPAAALMDEALALAERIAAQPGHALRVAKMLLKQGQMTSYDTSLELAAASQALMHKTEDHREGVRAMLEKRMPHFIGR